MFSCITLYFCISIFSYFGVSYIIFVLDIFLGCWMFIIYHIFWIYFDFLYIFSVFELSKFIMDLGYILIFSVHKLSECFFICIDG